jgi:hypothetical protein
MARDDIGKKDVLHLSSGTDIVNNKRPSALRAVGYKSDMGDARGKPPGHDVAGEVVAGPSRNRQGRAVSPEE